MKMIEAIIRPEKLEPVRAVVAAASAAVKPGLRCQQATALNAEVTDVVVVMVREQVTGLEGGVEFVPIAPCPAEKRDTGGRRVPLIRHY